jgi:hypothetical protein
MGYTVYKDVSSERQAFCPVFRAIGPPIPFGSKGGDTLACGEGVGVPNSDTGTDTMVHYV